MLTTTPGKTASRPNGGRRSRVQPTQVISPAIIDASAPAAEPRRQFNPITLGAKKKLATSLA